MQDQDKSKQQLIIELDELRRRVSEFEALDAARQKIEGDLQQYAQRQQALQELDRAVMASLRLNDIYHTFSRHAQRLLPYNRLSMTLVQGNQIEVIYIAGDAKSRDASPVGTIIPHQTSNISRVIAQGQPVLRNSITNEAGFAEDESLVASGIRSSMIIPLRAKGKIIGTCNIGSHEIGAYDPDDLDLAMSMAEPLASAIENAQLYEQAQEELVHRQRVEAALRESTERFHQVIVSISDHIYMSVFDAPLTSNPRPANYYISPNVEVLVGYPLENFVADWGFWRTLIHPDDLPKAILKPERLAQGGNSQVEYRLTCAGGEVIWVRDSRQIDIQKDISGQIREVTVYGVVSDITERRQLEEQLYQAQKMEAIGRLAGGVAHDFNNLLTVINGHAELLLHRHLAENDKPRPYVEQIKKAGDRAAAMTRQLLAFSRKQILQLTVLNLNEVVENIESMLRGLIGEDIELILKLEPELGQIRGDPGQMDQVILNLAINARDAMPNGGKLIIETANVEIDSTLVNQPIGLEAGAYVMILLRDTGHGMDANTKARIFEPFFTTKDQSQGTGLGLATVHGIVTQTNGYIWVDSEPGQGATFKIYLPRIEETRQEVKPEHVSPEQQTGSETIMLVEDEDLLRGLAHEVLGLEGYTVLSACNGLEALQLSEQYSQPIDLLVTDIIMPGGLNGCDLANRLALLRPDMKVLYISGYVDNALVNQSILNVGAAFLEKPFSPSILTRKVREVLDI